MTLTQDRMTAWRSGEEVAHPVKAGEVIYSGAIVCLDATSFAIAGKKGKNLRVVGIAQGRFDNSAGADGAIKAICRRGVFHLGQDGSLDRSHIGARASIADDESVTAPSTDHSLCGTIEDLDDQGVWVRI